MHKIKKNDNLSISDNKVFTTNEGNNYDLSDYYVSLKNKTSLLFVEMTL